MSFKIGDIVKIKNGNVHMTITGFKGKNIAICVYTDNFGNEKTKECDVSILGTV